MNPYKRTLVWMAKIAIFAVPFIPFYISHSLFFPFITGKAFAFRLLAEIAFFAWALLAYLFPEFRPKKSVMVWAITAFVGVSALATLFGVNPQMSFWSNFERMEGLITYLHLAAFFFAAAHTLKKKDWIVFLNLFVFAGILQAFYGLFQKMGFIPSPQGGFRVDGRVGNPTYFAAYLLFVMGFSSLLAALSKKRALRIYYGAAAIFSLLIIFFTATRGVLLALFVVAIGLGILYLFFGKRISASYKRKHVFLIAGGMAVLCLMVLGIKVLRTTPFVAGNEVLSRIASISLSEGGTRFTIWRMGWEGFKERPVLGWGPGNYPAVFAKYYEPTLYAQEPWFDRSHNIIFDWLINAGVLGIAAYGFLFYAAAASMRRWYGKMRTLEERQEVLQASLVVGGLLAAYLMQNLFVFDQLSTYIGIFSIFAFLHNMAAAEQKKEKEGNSRIGSSAPAVATIALCAVFFGTAYFSVGKPYLANRSLLSALVQAGSGDYAGVFNAYKKTLEYDTFGNGETREQLGRFAMEAALVEQIPLSLRESIARFAIAEMEKSASENPLDPRPKLFLAAAYRRFGDTDTALRTLAEAQALSPKKQQIFFEIADTYIQRSEFEKAVAAFEEAFALAPEFGTARINLAAGYIFNGEQAKADALLREGFGTEVVVDELLIQVYGMVRDYGRLIKTLEVLLATQPTVDNYRRLAGAHMLSGNRDAAIAVLEDAIQKFPEFEEEGRGYINDIQG